MSPTRVRSIQNHLPSQSLSYSLCPLTTLWLCLVDLSCFHPTTCHFPLCFTWNLTLARDMLLHLINIQPPRAINKVQRLTGRVDTLNHFISRATEKCTPFFKALHKKSIFQDQNCKKVIKKLKKYLSSPQLLTRSQPRDILTLFLTASKTTISEILVNKCLNQNQGYMCVNVQNIYTRDKVCDFI